MDVELKKPRALLPCGNNQRLVPNVHGVRCKACWTSNKMRVEDGTSEDTRHLSANFSVYFSFKGDAKRTCEEFKPMSHLLDLKTLFQVQRIFHLRSQKILYSSLFAWLTLWLCRCMQYVPLKHWWISARLHGVTSQQTVIFTVTSGRIPNPTCLKCIITQATLFTPVILPSYSGCHKITCFTVKTKIMHCYCNVNGVQTVSVEFYVLQNFSDQVVLTLPSVKRSVTSFYHCIPHLFANITI
jgi:hypothetical protein